MRTSSRTDEDLLSATDASSFEEFYLRHVDMMLGYFARRTGDAELAADLASETFAAALAGRRRYRPGKGAAGAWLFGIASRKLADAQRKGYAERRMCRRLGMERIELTDADIRHIEELGESALLEGLPATQAEAVRAHVIEERDYGEIAGELRHERGGGAQAGQPRAGHGAPEDREAEMSQDFTTRLQLQLREAAQREERRGALGRGLAGLRHGHARAGGGRRGRHGRAARGRRDRRRRPALGRRAAGVAPEGGRGLRPGGQPGLHQLGLRLRLGRGQQEPRAAARRPAHARRPGADPDRGRHQCLRRRSDRQRRRGRRLGDRARAEQRRRPPGAADRPGHEPRHRPRPAAREAGADRLRRPDRGGAAVGGHEPRRDRARSRHGASRVLRADHPAGRRAGPALVDRSPAASSG